jgi:hypothetical protein
MNEKFAVGQPVSRKEEPVPLRVPLHRRSELSRALYGVMVQPDGVWRLRSIDADIAREVPGAHMIVPAALGTAGINND